MDRFQNPNISNASRRTIASYPSYADAQKAVDYLSDNKFEVEKTAIVAEGLRFVEQVTGRLNWGVVISRAAGSGALTGVNHRPRAKSFYARRCSFAPRALRPRRRDRYQHPLCDFRLRCHPWPTRLFFSRWDASRAV